MALPRYSFTAVTGLFSECHEKGIWIHVVPVKSNQKSLMNAIDQYVTQLILTESELVSNHVDLNGHTEGEFPGRIIMNTHCRILDEDNEKAGDYSAPFGEEETDAVNNQNEGSGTTECSGNHTEDVDSAREKTSGSESVQTAV